MVPLMRQQRGVREFGVEARLAYGLPEQLAGSDAGIASKLADSRLVFQHGAHVSPHEPVVLAARHRTHVGVVTALVREHAVPFVSA